MKYQIFKLHFTTSVHFGEGGLMQAGSTLHADTLFSALCVEAVKMGDDILQQLVQAVYDDKLRFSDGLPYIKNRYYVPKPMVRLALDKQGDSVMKKQLKHLTFIPVEQLADYIQGTLNIDKTVNQFDNAFGKSFLTEKAVVRSEDETVPYAVEAFAYGKNGADSGLYICMAYEDEAVFELVESLLTVLGLTGIGGKISSGYGKFDLNRETIDEAYLARLTDDYDDYMLLSTALPNDTELAASLKDASYRLLKRSGFVASTTYANTFRKKKTVYVFQPGSCFKRRFNGQLLDVSDGSGAHPVYRYAKPLFLGVR